MKQGNQQIEFGDLQRILLGEVQGVFFLEVIVRSLFIYALLIVSMRVMGKRMSSQISRNEMAAMVSLAAAIGIPLQSPERGLLAAVVIAIVIVVFQRILANRVRSSERFEQATQGDIGVLVKDGVLCLEEMKRAGIGRERIFMELRVEGIVQLGQVDRLYLEANGSFTVLRREHPKAGLSLLPDWDLEFRALKENKIEQAVCRVCGKSRMLSSFCDNCDHSDFSKAVEAID